MHFRQTYLPWCFLVAARICHFPPEFHTWCDIFWFAATCRRWCRQVTPALSAFADAFAAMIAIMLEMLPLFASVFWYHAICLPCALFAYDDAMIFSCDADFLFAVSPLMPLLMPLSLLSPFYFHDAYAADCATDITDAAIDAASFHISPCLILPPCRFRWWCFFRIILLFHAAMLPPFSSIYFAFAFFFAHFFLHFWWFACHYADADAVAARLYTISLYADWCRARFFSCRFSLHADGYRCLSFFDDTRHAFRYAAMLSPICRYALAAAFHADAAARWCIWIFSMRRAGVLIFFAAITLVDYAHVFAAAALITPFHAFFASRCCRYYVTPLRHCATPLLIARHTPLFSFRADFAAWCCCLIFSRWFSPDFLSHAFFFRQVIWCGCCSLALMMPALPPWCLIITLDAADYFRRRFRLFAIFRCRLFIFFPRHCFDRYFSIFFDGADTAFLMPFRMLSLFSDAFHCHYFSDYFLLDDCFRRFSLSMMSFLLPFISLPLLPFVFAYFLFYFADAADARHWCHFRRFHFRFFFLFFCAFAFAAAFYSTPDSLHRHDWFWFRLIHDTLPLPFDSHFSPLFLYSFISFRRIIFHFLRCLDDWLASSIDFFRCFAIFRFLLSPFHSSIFDFARFHYAIFSFISLFISMPLFFLFLLPPFASFRAAFYCFFDCRCHAFRSCFHAFSPFRWLFVWCPMTFDFRATILLSPFRLFRLPLRMPLMPLRCCFSRLSISDFDIILISLLSIHFAFLFFFLFYSIIIFSRWFLLC